MKFEHNNNQYTRYRTVRLNPDHMLRMHHKNLILQNVLFYSHLTTSLWLFSFLIDCIPSFSLQHRQVFFIEDTELLSMKEISMYFVLSCIWWLLLFYNIEWFLVPKPDVKNKFSWHATANLWMVFAWLTFATISSFLPNH